MKILPKAVDAFLAAPQRDCNAVLVYGVDGGLVRERCNKIIKSVLGKAADDSFAKIELYEPILLADPPRLADELSAISMMCPKRVIIIRDASDKLSKIIESASSNFHKDNFLIVSADELSAKSSLRSLFEKQQSCAAIACYKDEIRDVQNIVRRHLDSEKISYNREIVDYLVEHLGNDRYVTYQELEKLVLYAGDDKKLTLHEVQLLVDYNQDTQLDDLINSVADGNPAKLEKTLTTHLREGIQPIIYLRALQRYFNRLYAIRAQMQENSQSAEMIISGLRPPVFFKQIPTLTRHANMWTIENIVKALKLLVSAEIFYKSSDIPAVPASSRKLFQVTQIRHK